MLLLQDKDVFVVGCHEDNFLHVFDLSQDTTEEVSATSPT